MACCKVPKRGISFEPDYNIGLLITPKFYARHDCAAADAKILERTRFYEEEIALRRSYEKKKVFAAPQTENQIYGWLEHLVKERELNRDQYRINPYDKEFHKYMDLVAATKKNKF